jgi:hypothetical protein
VYHKLFDDQLIKLNPQTLLWEIDNSVHAEPSGDLKTRYRKLHRTKLENKIILNAHVLQHRYLRKSKDVDINAINLELSQLQLSQLDLYLSLNCISPISPNFHHPCLCLPWLLNRLGDK